jgi:hypothetical protein
VYGNRTLACGPGTAGTTITYAAELGLTGALKFAEPFLNKTFGAMADKAVEGLAAWLSAGTTT